VEYLRSVIIVWFAKDIRKETSLGSDLDVNIGAQKRALRFSMSNQSACEEDRFDRLAEIDGRV
jgi:hypothetical protein